MKIKYKNEKYNVKMKDAIKIEKRKILLYLRRIKRFGLRILNVFKKDLMILLIAIILYVIAVIIIEHKFMQKCLLEIIWGTKSEVFTVFVVVAMNSIIVSERRWRQTIRNWHDIYADYQYHFESDIYDLFNFSGINIKNEYKLLYTRELFENFKNEVEKKEIIENQINRNKVIKVLEKIKNELDDLKEYVLKNDFLEDKNEFSWNYRWLKNYIYKVEEKVEDGETNFKNELINIIGTIYSMISYIRRTWRTEISLDREIIDILKIDNKNRIESDYYLSAISYKFER